MPAAWGGYHHLEKQRFVLQASSQCSLNAGNILNILRLWRLAIGMEPHRRKSGGRESDLDRSESELLELSLVPTDMGLLLRHCFCKEHFEYPLKLGNSPAPGMVFQGILGKFLPGQASWTFVAPERGIFSGLHSCSEWMSWEKSREPVERDSLHGAWFAAFVLCVFHLSSPVSQQPDKH